MLPGLLQTRDYARAVIAAAGAADPDDLADARMRRQETVLSARGGPRYEVVLDARALLIGIANVDLVRVQVEDLAHRADQVRRLDLRVIPIGRPTPVFSTVGFTVKRVSSPLGKVAWRKSSHSGDGGCVGVADLSGRIGVRDSKAGGVGSPAAAPPT